MKDYWIKLSMEEREMTRTALLFFIVEYKMPESIEKKWRNLYDKINY